MVDMLPLVEASDGGKLRRFATERNSEDSVLRLTGRPKDTLTPTLAVGCV